MSLPELLPGRYRHYKGGFYEVIGVARHSETEEEYVVYRPLYGEGGLWIRPRVMFQEMVEVEGRALPRFAFCARMQVGNYKFHRRARMAFRGLLTEEQDQTLAALTGLADTPISDWPNLQAKKLSGDDGMYLVPIDDSLRMFVQAGDGREMEVMDFVRRETLESFNRAPPRP